MTTPFIRSITDRLKRLARERQAPYGEILTQFMIERAVARLVLEPTIQDHLVFKGDSLVSAFTAPLDTPPISMPSPIAKIAGRLVAL